MRIFFLLVFAFISTTSFAQINSARDNQDSKSTLSFKLSFPISIAVGTGHFHPKFVKAKKGKEYFNMPVYSPKNIPTIPTYIPDNVSKMPIKKFKEENRLWKK